MPPIDPKTGRPVAGPGTDAEIKASLNKTFEDRKKRSEETKRKQVEEENAARAEKKRKRKKQGNTLSDLLDPAKKRERTVRGENTTLSEAVEEGVRQGTEADKKRK